eukprot:TRINITY_DN4521_c0_g1_i3.p1 TRINITY_DN4521_c0_g1~~TRINITY_DN4521_c0_g1_i3.p1  ORF type:complete len:338 (+),score=36.35 TRINITY_DN4521_c0_g1_i3:41-1015(+)
MAVARLAQSGQRPGSAAFVKRTIFTFGTRANDPYTIIHHSNVVAPQLRVPENIKRPSYVHESIASHDPMAPIPVISASDIDLLRSTASLTRTILEEAAMLASQGGITTNDLDVFVHEQAIEAGAYPSTLGYHNFPKSICTSINNVLVHGIPDATPLQDGDIISLDLTLYRDGFHGDTCITVGVGNVDDAAQKLMLAGQKCLQAGIDVCRPGQSYAAIGDAIWQAAEELGVHVNTDYTGHGIGRDFHQAPSVLPFPNPVEDWIMEPGHVFTIEPVVHETSETRSRVLPDGWTVVSKDDGRTAQYEHTVAITEQGCEILTKARPSR